MKSDFEREFQNHLKPSERKKDLQHLEKKVFLLFYSKYRTVIANSFR